jgi:hypothetical protein
VGEAVMQENSPEEVKWLVVAEEEAMLEFRLEQY